MESEQYYYTIKDFAHQQKSLSPKAKACRFLDIISYNDEINNYIIDFSLSCLKTALAFISFINDIKTPIKQLVNNNSSNYDFESICSLLPETQIHNIQKCIYKDFNIKELIEIALQILTSINTHISENTENKNKIVSFFEQNNHIILKIKDSFLITKLILFYSYNIDDLFCSNNIISPYYSKTLKFIFDNLVDISINKDAACVAIIALEELLLILFDEKLHYLTETQTFVIENFGRLVEYIVNSYSLSKTSIELTTLVHSQSFYRLVRNFFFFVSQASKNKFDGSETSDSEEFDFNVLNVNTKSSLNSLFGHIKKDNNIEDNCEFGSNTNNIKVNNNFLNGYTQDNIEFNSKNANMLNENILMNIEKKTIKLTNMNQVIPNSNEVKEYFNSNFISNINNDLNSFNNINKHNNANTDIDKISELDFYTTNHTYYEIILKFFWDIVVYDIHYQNNQHNFNNLNQSNMNTTNNIINNNKDSDSGITALDSLKFLIEMNFSMLETSIRKHHYYKIIEDTIINNLNIIMKLNYEDEVFKLLKKIVQDKEIPLHPCIELTHLLDYFENIIENESNEILGDCFELYHFELIFNIINRSDVIKEMMFGRLLSFIFTKMNLFDKDSNGSANLNDYKSSEDMLLTTSNFLSKIKNNKKFYRKSLNGIDGSFLRNNYNIKMLEIFYCFILVSTVILNIMNNNYFLSITYYLLVLLARIR